MYYVYVLREPLSGWLKIGRSVDVSVRKDEIELGLGKKLELLMQYGYDSHQASVTVENYLHIKCKEFRAPVHRNVEWFTAEAASLLPRHVNSRFATNWLATRHPLAHRRGRRVWSVKHDMYVIVYKEQVIQPVGFVTSKAKKSKAFNR